MGCKFLNHHLMLVLLIQLFLLIPLFVNGQFIPGPRSGHTATLIGDKIYFIGGSNFSNTNQEAESDVFYYDGNKLAWVEVNSQVNGQDADIPPKHGHTANVGGRNQDLIFIIGGDRFSIVYQLDTKTNKIITPIILGALPIRDSLSFMSSVIYEGKIYLFGGGYMDIKTDITTLYDNHCIFNTNNLKWEDGSLVSAPPPRYKHTATLVNEIIYYIGGIQINNSYVSYPLMSDIFRYSTRSNTWSSVVATLAPGNTPGPRLGHSAVLVEGKICIFGGSFNDLSPTESIAMLDTSTLEWSIPSFKNPRRSLPNLVYHTATLVDKRMLVAFGNDTDKSVDAVTNGFKGLNNDFYIFDFNKMEWYITTADELTKPSSNIPKLFSSSSAGTSSNSAIIGLSVGIVLGVLVIVGTVIFVYYRRKKNQSKNDVGYPADYVSYPADDSNISYDKFSFSQRSTLYSSQPSMQYQSTNQHQQFTPEQRISNNNNLTQPQGYIGQEYSILRIPSDGDRLSNHSFNYRPGNGIGAYSQRSEAPLPPPPSTDPHSQGSEAPLPPPPSTDSHSQGSEAPPLPSPPLTDPHSQGSEAPPLPSPPLTDPHSQESKALLPSPPLTDPHSQESKALLPPPPPPKTP